MGVVHAKVPLTAVPFAVAVPPDRVDDASVWPYVIPLAAGDTEIVGAAAATVSVTDPVTVA